MFFHFLTMILLGICLGCSKPKTETSKQVETQSYENVNNPVTQYTDALHESVHKARAAAAKADEVNAKAESMMKNLEKGLEVGD